MQKFSQRVFKGLSTDISVEDISELATPLCQDVCVTPRGALSTPLGMTKWNTTSLGFINGGFDYRGRVGQYVLSFASTAGAGYPTGAGAGVTISGGAAVSGTIDATGEIQGSTYSVPPTKNNTITLSITGNVYNSYGFPLVSGYTLNASVSRLWTGTLTLTYGIGTGGTTSMAVVNGVGSVSNTFYDTSGVDLPLYITANGTGCDQGTLTVTAYYVYLDWSGAPYSFANGAGAQTLTGSLKSSAGTYDWSEGSGVSVSMSMTPYSPSGWFTSDSIASGVVTGTGVVASYIPPISGFPTYIQVVIVGGVHNGKKIRYSDGTTSGTTLSSFSVVE